MPILLSPLPDAETCPPICRLSSRPTHPSLPGCPNLNRRLLRNSATSSTTKDCPSAFASSSTITRQQGFHHYSLAHESARCISARSSARLNGHQRSHQGGRGIAWRQELRRLTRRPRRCPTAQLNADVSLFRNPHEDPELEVDCEVMIAGRCSALHPHPLITAPRQRAGKNARFFLPPLAKLAYHGQRRAHAALVLLSYARQPRCEDGYLRGPRRL
jgi:hypothetical protein